MKHIISLIFLFSCAKVSAQENPFPMIAKLEIVGHVVSPNFDRDYDFPMGKQSKGQFDLEFIYSHDYCKKNALERTKNIYALWYMIQNYVFKDSLQYLQGVKLYVSDSAKTCNFTYSFASSNYDKLTIDEQLQKVVELLPFEATIEHDDTPDRILIVINLDKGFCIMPDLDVYLINLAILVNDFVIKPTKLKVYNKAIFICKRGGKVEKLSSYNFADRRFSQLYTKSYLVYPPKFKTIPQVNIGQLKQ
jgi:hypothetical protein